MADYTSAVTTRWDKFCEKNFTSGKWPVRKDVVALMVEDTKLPTLEFFLGETDSTRVQGSGSWELIESSLTSAGTDYFDDLAVVPALSVLNSEETVVLGTMGGISSAISGIPVPTPSDFLNWDANGTEVLNTVSDTWGLIKDSPLGKTYADMFFENDFRWGSMLTKRDEVISFHNVLVPVSESTYFCVNRVAILIDRLTAAGVDPEVTAFESISMSEVKKKVKPGYTIFRVECYDTGTAIDYRNNSHDVGGVLFSASVRVKTGWHNVPVMDDDSRTPGPVIRTWREVDVDPSELEGYIEKTVDNDPGRRLPLLTNGANQVVDVRANSELKAGWVDLAALTRAESKDEWAIVLDQGQLSKSLLVNSIQRDGYKLHILTVKSSSRYMNIPLRWFAAKVAEGLEEGSVTQAEADEMNKDLDSKKGLSLRVVNYSTGVKIPKELVMSTDVHRKYAKSRKKACKDDDFGDLVFTDGLTYGQLNTKLNGMPSMKWFFSLTDPSLSRSLQWDDDEAINQAISFLDTTDKTLGVALKDVNTGALIQSFEEGDQAPLMLYIRGARLSGLSKVELLSVTKTDELAFENLKTQHGDATEITTASVKTGLAVKAASAMMRYDANGTALSGYPDAKSLQTLDSQRFARCVMRSVGGVPFGREAVMSALQEISLV